MSLTIEDIAIHLERVYNFAIKSLKRLFGILLATDISVFHEKYITTKDI